MVYVACTRKHIALVYDRDVELARTTQYAGAPNPCQQNAELSWGARACIFFYRNMHFALVIDRGGRPVHTGRYDDTPAVSHTKQYKVTGGTRTWSICCRNVRVAFAIDRMVGMRAAGNMLAPPPSLSKTMQSNRRAPAHDRDFAATSALQLFLAGLAGMRTAGNMSAPPRALSKTHAK